MTYCFATFTYRIVGKGDELRSEKEKERSSLSERVGRRLIRLKSHELPTISWPFGPLDLAILSHFEAQRVSFPRIIIGGSL